MKCPICNLDMYDEGLTCPKCGIKNGQVSVRTLLMAAHALVNKLEEVAGNEQYSAMWTLAQVHGMDYTGPCYFQDLANLKYVLKDAETSDQFKTTKRDREVVDCESNV